MVSFMREEREQAKAERAEMEAKMDAKLEEQKAQMDAKLEQVEEHKQAMVARVEHVQIAELHRPCESVVGRVGDATDDKEELVDERARVTATWRWRAAIGTGEKWLFPSHAPQRVGTKFEAPPVALRFFRTYSYTCTNSSK